MHPQIFLKRGRLPDKPPMSERERAEHLSSLSNDIAGKRTEAVNARSASGIESVWKSCEEAYLGIDDANRHEFNGAEWAKPSSMAGPLTSEYRKTDNTRSTAYPRLTSRYVDTAAAKLAELLLPIDDKAFSFEATPDPDLVKHLGNKGPLVHPETGQPITMAAQQYGSAPSAASGPQLPPGQPPGAPAPAMMQNGPPPPGVTAGQPPMQPGQAGPGPSAPQQAQPSAPPTTAADIAQEILDQANESAKLAENRIYGWMIDSNYPGEMRKLIHDAARIGVGVLKGPFPERKESRAVTKKKNKDGSKEIGLEVVIETKPSLKWIDPWNFFPHEGCGEEVCDGDYTFERDFISAKKLERLADQPGYLQSQIDSVILEGPGKCYIEGPETEDVKKRFEIWYFYGQIDREMLEIAQAVGIEDIPEDQKKVDVIVSMVNDRIIRAVINPLDSGDFPYHVMTWSRRPGHWAGVGVAEQISMPQRMVTAATRALLNNAGLTAGPQIIIDQIGIVPADGSPYLTPNKIWYKTADSMSTDVREAFYAVDIPSSQKEMQGIIEYGMKLAEESCGIPLITQGQTGPSSPDTFGQAELQDNNAHTWLRSIAERFDDMLTEPLVHCFYEYLLLDPSVPDREKGDFEINAQGSVAMVERAIQEQTLTSMLQASSNPAYKIDPAKLFALLLKAKRMNPDDVQYTKAEQEKMEAQPPSPPLPILLEQMKGQNAMQVVQAKAQAEMQQSAQEMQNQQALLQNGGSSPHEAAAMAKIEATKIAAQSNENIQASRAQAEQAYANTEAQIARDNAAAKHQEILDKRELLILEYSLKNNQTLDQVKASLAERAMQEQTKQKLAELDSAVTQSEGAENRHHDMVKHLTTINNDNAMKQAELAASVQIPGQ